MSRCEIMFNKPTSGKILRRDVDGCSVCNRPGDREKDACVWPPIGEPKELTIVAPVVFDECGINLCKVIQRDIFKDERIARIQLQVIDIQFNVGCEEGSKVEYIKDRPNCVRVTLSNICVKFAVKLLDFRNHIIDNFCITELYLPDEEDEAFDPDTNPTSLSIDIYTPYGVSYLDNCRECLPTINFLGFLDGCEDKKNNDLSQGIDAQALAEVVKFDNDEGIVAIGLTIYLKVVYFIQYKIPHCGLCVPPKCEPINPIVEDACKDFVEGDLLEQNIQPLEVGQNSRTIEPFGSEPVEDPTPAGAIVGGGNPEVVRNIPPHREYTENGRTVYDFTDSHPHNVEK